MSTRPFPVPTLRPPLPVAPTMKRLGAAIRTRELPAIEKIAEELMGDAFQVLISTMLSAQTKDPVTLAASLRLFAVAPDAASLARLSTARIEKLIYPVSFYRNKAVFVRDAARMIVEKFGGQVPSTLAELITLPGVGRKTANVVLSMAFGHSTMAVDTHIFRIANRLCLAPGKTPDEVEDQLMRIVPDHYLYHAHHWLILHGRYCCKARKPECSRCVIADICKAAEKTNEIPAPLIELPAQVI
jgi:endonuclease-3